MTYINDREIVLSISTGITVYDVDSYRHEMGLLYAFKDRNNDLRETLLMATNKRCFTNDFEIEYAAINRCMKMSNEW